MSLTEETLDSISSGIKKIREEPDIDEKVAFPSGHVFTSVPVNLYKRDDREEKLANIVELKQQLDPEGTLLGTINPTEYADFIDKRLREWEHGRFVEYVSKSFDPESAYELQKIQEIFPEFWEERRKEIHNNREDLERFAKIYLKGPQSRDDYYFLYCIWSGIKQLDPKAIETVLGLNTPSEQFTERYVSGLLSPRKLFSYDKPSEIAIVNPFMPMKPNAEPQYTNKTIQRVSPMDVIKTHLKSLPK